ncbi:hypothetical protein VRQ87_003970 [Morganella morganii]|nr:hypothetical protein [Morganella morganii]EMD6374032.1 hypothetical protein [Morganella morganii]
MFKVYAANEVRGDKTYKNKKALISGVVKNIIFDRGCSCR